MAMMAHFTLFSFVMLLTKCHASLFSPMEYQECPEATVTTKSDFILSVFPPEAADGCMDSVEVMCRYKNPPFINLIYMSILHSTLVEKPDFKYISGVNSFNNRIQKQLSSLKNVTGKIDNRDGSFMKLVIDDSTVRKTGLYKCEVIGLDVEQGRPLIASKEIVIKTFESKIKSLMEIFNNKSSLLQESIEALQLKSINNTMEIKDIKYTLTKTELAQNDDLSKVKVDNVNIQNALQNMTKLNNEFEKFLQLLNNTVSGLENNLNNINAKFEKVEKLVNDNRKDLENVKNESISEEFIKKHFQKVESSITQQKNFTQVAVDKLEAVKKRQDDMADQLTKLNSGSKSLESLFIPSTLFKGRKYWLTRTNYTMETTDAHAFCLKYGGYLTEIDTEEEYIFVKAFLDNNKKFAFVYLGGTDSMQEGVWINRFSLLKVSVFHWHHGEPNNHENEDCLCFWDRLGYIMNDCKCFMGTYYAYGPCGFLCEIPIL